MKITKKVSNKLSTITGELADLLDDGKLTDEEKEAINEAIKLADEFSYIKPEQLVISGKHLFTLNG